MGLETFILALKLEHSLNNFFNSISEKKWHIKPFFLNRVFFFYYLSFFSKISLSKIFKQYFSIFLQDSKDFHNCFFSIFFQQVIQYIVADYIVKIIIFKRHISNISFYKFKAAYLVKFSLA